MSQLPTENLYRDLLGVTGSLAADADSQVGLLPPFVNASVELAQMYSELFALAGDLVKAGLIDESQYRELEGLDLLLADLPRQDRVLWSDDGLRTRQEWEAVREHARRILLRFERERVD